MEGHLLLRRTANPAEGRDGLFSPKMRGRGKKTERKGGEVRMIPLLLLNSPPHSVEKVKEYSGR